MLLDQYGRPVQFELLKEEQAAPTLAGVRNIYSIIDSSLGLTPEKIVMILRQAEYGDPWLYLELAERMEEKDELYQGVLHTRKMAVSQLDMKIEAASNDAQDQADAAFRARGSAGRRARLAGRRFRNAQRARQRLLGNGDHLEHPGPQSQDRSAMVDSGAPGMARPAMVHVRLDFREATARALAAD